MIDVSWLDILSSLVMSLFSLLQALFVSLAIGGGRIRPYWSMLCGPAWSIGLCWPIFRFMFCHQLIACSGNALPTSLVASVCPLIVYNKSRLLASGRSSVFACVRLCLLSLLSANHPSTQSTLRRGLSVHTIRQIKAH